MVRGGWWEIAGASVGDWGGSRSIGLGLKKAGRDKLGMKFFFSCLLSRITVKNQLSIYIYYVYIYLVNSVILVARSVF